MNLFEAVSVILWDIFMSYTDPHPGDDNCNIYQNGECIQTSDRLTVELHCIVVNVNHNNLAVLYHLLSLTTEGGNANYINAE
jgi:hypothetical protein